MEFLGLVILGIFAGVLSGLLGLGGGVILVPGLMAFFIFKHFPSQVLMQFATGTTLTAMIFTTGMATWAQNKYKNVRWPLLKILLPGLLIGAACGALLLRYISTNHLRYGFVFLVSILGIRMLVGIEMIFNADNEAIKMRSHSRIVVFMLTGIIGVLASLLGIGGGVLLIPFLMWLGLPMVQATSTSIASVFPTITLGAIGAMFVGWHSHQALPPLTVGYVYWPGALLIGVGSVCGVPAGAYLANHLPTRIIKRIFGGVLLIAAWQMLPKWPL